MDIVLDSIKDFFGNYMLMSAVVAWLSAQIIKIFTVINIIFLPPTLIASMYGMNFDIMPELHFKYGYLLAIGLMLSSVAIIMGVFKWKKWL